MARIRLTDGSEFYVDDVDDLANLIRDRQPTGMVLAAPVQGGESVWVVCAHIVWARWSD